MPEHSGTFRSGDRVEIVRSGHIREIYRGRRGVVQTVNPDTGKVSVRLDNPPLSEVSGAPTHGGRWNPHNLRLVERTQPLVGDTVRVADPAYVRADRTGGVSVNFYGATCKVRSCYESRGDDSVWSVELLNHPGATNVINQAYLTVIEHGLEMAGEPSVTDTDTDTDTAAFPFVMGAPVQIDRRPVYYPGGDSDEVDRAFWGAQGHLSTDYDGDRWNVMLPDGATNTIHISSLTVTGPPVVDRFAPGAWVHVAPGARTAPEGQVGIPVGASFQDKDVVVISTHPGGICNVRLFDRTSTAVVHESYLTEIEREPIVAGQIVQALPRPRYRRDHETTTVGGSSASSLGERIGTVLRAANDRGNVRVSFTGIGNEFVHAGFLRVLTPEEAAAIISVGDLVRVNTDATFVGTQVQIQGRVGTVERHDPNQRAYLVAAPPRRDWVDADGLTKLDRNLPLTGTQYRCSTCRQPVETDVAHVESGSAYCVECTADCSGCNQTAALSSLVYVETDAGLCPRCAQACAYCGNVQPVAVMQVNPDNGSHYCTGCTRVCAGTDCEERLWGSSSRHCSACRADGPEGLIWRHTVPEMWLGGPVRNDGGYYIGFENEISASGEYRLRPLREWALANLGSREGLDLKSDSSVRGFEIATQPMTPVYFEAVDWDSFFEVINTEYPVPGGERSGHGLHVHIGRQAFRRPRWNKRSKRTVMVTDDGMIAAFSYLLAHHTPHLERIARRSATEYCGRVADPVKRAISRMEKETRQKQRIHANAGRDAINLGNSKTIEIRAFKAARSTKELKDAVRLVYVAAEYVRFLRSKGAISPGMLSWSAFSMWVASVHPQAFASISGLDAGVSPEMAVDLSDLAKEAERFKSQPVPKELNRVMETPDLVAVTATPGAASIGESLEAMREQMEQATQAMRTMPQPDWDVAPSPTAFSVSDYTITPLEYVEESGDPVPIPAEDLDDLFEDEEDEEDETF